MPSRPTNPADVYESYMAPALFRPWAARLLQAALPRSGERVLDVGCGTGVVARLAAAQVGATGSVVGLDVNPRMLAVARAEAVREGAAIAWHEGRAEALPFADGSFDLVLCQFALMYFADRRAAMGEMHRVLADGGRLALSVWQGLDRHPFYESLHLVFEERLGMSSLAEIFALGDPAALRALMTQGGFHRIGVEPVMMTARFPNPDGFLAGEIESDTAAIPSMQRLDEREWRQITEAIRAEMEKPLQDVSQDGAVVLPFHAFIVRATR